MDNKTLARILDVQSTPNGTCVVYAVEDRETQGLWQGPLPEIGDLFMIDPRNLGRDAQLLAKADLEKWKPDSDALRWRKPLSGGKSISRMNVLRQRHVIQRATRDYFDRQDFIEIDTPLLVHGAPPDNALDSFRVGDRYLITSSEYQLRRLVVGGFSRVYSLTKNFRFGDQSPVRNPEFSMLEWGRVGSTMKDIEHDTEAFVSNILERLKRDRLLPYKGKKIDLTPPWDRMSVLEAIERFTGVLMHDFEAHSCRKALSAAGVAIKPNWQEDRDFLFSLLMDHLQPNLGKDRPVFLTEWPFFQTTTAASDPAKPDFAQRSELFVAGIEIADGFADLTDGAVQETLFKNALENRIHTGKDSIELDVRYMDSMKLGYPSGAAMALGFDRLVMLLTDQSEIQSVLAFGWDEV